VAAVVRIRRPMLWGAGLGPGGSSLTSRACLSFKTRSHSYIIICCFPSGWLRITLEIMTLQPKCEDVETAEGVAITVTGVAQVKVMTENELLGYACEQFLGKSVIEIKSVILQTLEGHLRAILGG
ncbi:Flotillin-2a, partial [Goodea atripinnis]